MSIPNVRSHKGIKARRSLRKSMDGESACAGSRRRGAELSKRQATVSGEVREPGQSILSDDQWGKLGSGGCLWEMVG